MCVYNIQYPTMYSNQVRNGRRESEAVDYAMPEDGGGGDVGLFLLTALLLWPSGDGWNETSICLRVCS
jgi:hypothetical protein